MAIPVPYGDQFKTEYWHFWMLDNTKQNPMKICCSASAEYYETLLEITPVTSFLARMWERLTKRRNADIDQSRLFASIFKNDQPITTQLITITTCSPLLGRGSKTDAAPSKQPPPKSAIAGGNSYQLTWLTSSQPPRCNNLPHQRSPTD